MKNELTKINENLFQKIDELVSQMKNRVATTVNTAMVHTYFEIGRYIVEDEQNGKLRAEYGKAVLKDISTRLTEKYGNGWSVENLKLMRKFFTIYSVSDSKKVNTVYQISDEEKSELVPQKSNSVNTVYEIQQKPEFTLSWSHYLILMQMYVNYFDRYVKQDFENPTIGILLCKQKDDALVELILPKDSNIYAQQYALYLPDKKLLQEKLTEWLQDEEVK